MISWRRREHRFSAGLNFDLFTAEERRQYLRGKTIDLVLMDRKQDRGEARLRTWALAGLLMAAMHRCPHPAELMCRPRP